MSFLSLSLPTMWAMLLRTSCSCAMAKNAIASMHFLRMSGARPISRQSLSCGVVAKVSCKQGFLAHAGRGNPRFRAARLLRRRKKREHQSAPLRWRRRRDYLRAVPLMASSAGKVSVPFLLRTSPPSRANSCLIHDFERLVSCAGAKKGSTKVLPCAGAEDEIICGLRP